MTSGRVPYSYSERIIAFWSKVEKTNTCWIWTGSKVPRGYGTLSWGKRIINAHRIAWTLTFDRIPSGLFVCHKCDTPSCVNPSHLFLGTARDNTQDALRKGRLKSPNAKLTEQIVREIRKRETSMRKLAKLYGVTRLTVQQAANKKTWKHVR
jgi:hypothetical protein